MNSAIPYAVAGGMALFEHGFRRFTDDVDILVTREGLKTIHARLDGLGYVPPFTGSKNLRDTEYGVRIEFLIAGEFPGDGKPKAGGLPGSANSRASIIDGIRYLTLPKLVELKLASGMTGGIHRMKDLADVVALIEDRRPSRRVRRGAQSLRPRQVPRTLAGHPGIPGRPGRGLSWRGRAVRGRSTLIKTGIGRALALATRGVEEYNLLWGILGHWH